MTPTKEDGSTKTINDAGSRVAVFGVNDTDIPALSTLQDTAPNQAVDSVADPNQNVTFYKKGLDGFVAETRDAEGAITQIARDLKGFPAEVSVYSPDNIVGGAPTNPVPWDDSVGTGHLLSQISYKFDSNDLLQQVTNELSGETESWTYDSLGNILTHTNANNKTYGYQYQPGTSFVIATSGPTTPDYPDGHVINYSYNSRGLIHTVQDLTLGRTTIYNYDSTDRVLQSITAPSGHSAHFTFDSAGNLQSVVNEKQQSTWYQYDPFNRVQTITALQGVSGATGATILSTTRYEYYGNGATKQVTDSNGNKTQYIYNNVERLSEIVDTFGNKVELYYDAVGNLKTRVDAFGTSTFNYDPKNRLYEKLLPDDHVQYFRDFLGNVYFASNNETVVTSEFDNSNRLKHSTLNAGAHPTGPIAASDLTYSYHPGGTRQSMSDGSVELDYTFDDQDKLTQIRNVQSGEVFGFAYNAGRLHTITRPNSVGHSDIEYDSSNLLASITHFVPSGQLGVTYQNDSIGDVSYVSTSAGTGVVNYDSLNQIASFVNPEATGAFATESFFFDSIGNRVSDPSLPTNAYSYYLSQNNTAVSDRLKEDPSFKYDSYDNNGNLTQKTSKATGEVTKYYYTSENRLRTVEFRRSAGSLPYRSVGYAYDVLGRRMRKVVSDFDAGGLLVNSQTRLFGYDDQDMIAEYDASSNLLARYTYSRITPDDVLAVAISSQGVARGIAPAPSAYYFLKDKAGSVTDIVDSSGTPVQHQVYSAFGMLILVKDSTGGDITSSPIITIPMAYTGRELDRETGLYYYRARYYDSGSGRFLSSDPMGFDSGDQNLYCYAHNNPILYLDPTGMISSRQITWIAGGAAVGIIAIYTGGAGLGLMGFIGEASWPAALTEVAPWTVEAAISGAEAIPQWLITGGGVVGGLGGMAAAPTPAQGDSNGNSSGSGSQYNASGGDMSYSPPSGNPGDSPISLTSVTSLVDIENNSSNNSGSGGGASGGVQCTPGSGCQGAVSIPLLVLPFL